MRSGEQSVENLPTVGESISQDDPNWGGIMRMFKIMPYADKLRRERVNQRSRWEFEAEQAICGPGGATGKEAELSALYYFDYEKIIQPNLFTIRGYKNISQMC